MAVHSFLDASTAHLTSTERALLAEPEHAHVPDDMPPTRSHEYGAFVHVPADLAERTELAEVAPNIHAVLTYAAERGCWWVNFDSDGEQIDDLPTYDERDIVIPAAAPECDCADALVPGAIAGMDTPEGIQRCDDCKRLEGDLEAAAALAALVGGVVRFEASDGQQHTWTSWVETPEGLHIARETNPWVEVDGLPVDWEARRAAAAAA